IDWVADFLDHADRYPVVPPVKPGELTDSLPAEGPERGESMDAVVADFERLIVPAMTQWNHPGFMAYFANSSPPEAILGELLAAALNGNGMVWKTSPAVTELEQDQVRKIPVDSAFRMRPDALAESVERDLAAGLRPCCVTATVGTTSTTSVDPVPAIADICARHNLWLHVDAAYAGSAAIVPE